MDVKVLEQKEDSITLSLTGTDATFANLLRRYIIEKVPTMAIEEVEFKTNTGALYDEIVAHRLGLLPLSTDLKSYEIAPENQDEWNNKNTLKLTLKASGPGIVEAKQIKSKDPKVKPIQEGMPIVKLLKEQEIEVVATAVLGQGTQHAKFSPGWAFYKFQPTITINKQPKDAKSFVENCPVEDVFILKGNSVDVNKNNLDKAGLVEDYIKQTVGDDIVVGHSEEIIFELESFGQLSCKEILSEAMNQYVQDLDEFSKLLK